MAKNDELLTALQDGDINKARNITADLNSKNSSVNKFLDSIEAGKKELEFKAVETSGKIEERSVLYSSAVTEIKAPELQGVSNSEDRLKIINAKGIEPVDAEKAKEWAKLDIAEYKKIDDKFERQFAALEMSNNIALNKAYTETVKQLEPDIYKEIEQHRKESDRLIEEKESRQSANAEVSHATLAGIAASTAAKAARLREAGERIREAQNPVTAESLKDSIEGEKAKDKAVQPIPEELNKKYLIKGDNEKATYYYGNDTEREAFKDTGNKIVARSEGAAIARSMVALAEAKGWDSIKASGKEEFRREVWLEAQKRGLTVTGYEPTPQDKQNAEKMINKITQDAQTPSNATIAKTTVAGAAVVASADPSNGAEAVKVAVATAATVKAAVVDINKDKKSETEKAKDLKQELREAYSNLPREEAIKKHPELEPLYKLEQAAHQFANNSPNLSKEDKGRFVASVRDKGFDSLSQGKTLPQVKERTIEKPQERTSEISR